MVFLIAACLPFVGLVILAQAPSGAAQAPAGPDAVAANLVSTVCASCHTQPESAYYARAQQSPHPDLASIHLAGVHLVGMHLLALHLASVYLDGVYTGNVHLLAVHLLVVLLRGVHITVGS